MPGAKGRTGAARAFLGDVACLRFLRHPAGRRA